MKSKVDISSLSKLYYSIGEIADMFNVNHSLIRFWEKEFTQIQPKKNSKGNRLFTPKDIENFNKIYTLVKVQGFTLEGAKKELKKKNSAEVVVEESVPNQQQIIDKLSSIKERLLSLKGKK